MTEERRAAVATMLGASPRSGSFGPRMLIEAQRGSARVHLVNSHYDDIGGLQCASSLADLDEPVDLALLGVPDAVLAEQVKAAAAAGARSAVLFGTAPGLCDEIAATATAAGMALCGAGWAALPPCTIPARNARCAPTSRTSSTWSSPTLEQRPSS
jgi:acyl-CoA synthetase (NDP forming)